MRRSVLGDQAFTKEELALKSIRDGAEATSASKAAQQSKVPNSYQRHVAQMNAQRQEEAKNKAKKQVGFIPCLYLPYLGGSSKLLIYFHGNAEDVGLAMELLAFVKDMLKVRKR